MENSSVVLCAALQQLQEEHMLLREEMDFFYGIIEEIEFDSGPIVAKLFVELHRLLCDFTDKLKFHSNKEEEWLFPMMIRHLAENDRTIEEMEREHEKAEKHLQDFLYEADKAGTSISGNTAQWITVYAFQAHAILIQHFAKEERFLFPLAEKILSPREKMELEGLFQVQ